MPLLDPNAPPPPSPFLDERAPSGAQTILGGPDAPPMPPPEQVGSGHDPIDHVIDGAGDVVGGLWNAGMGHGDGLQQAANGLGEIVEGVVEGIFGDGKPADSSFP
jgi:hypothetical protein